MTKKQNGMEQLVEETAERFIEFVDWVQSGAQRGGRGANQHATEIITRILSAVRDGRLDEALGVVGRFHWPEEHEEWYDGEAENFVCHVFYQEKANALIAIRKEEEK